MKANIKRNQGGGSRSGGAEIARRLLSALHTGISPPLSAWIPVRAHGSWTLSTAGAESVPMPPRAADAWGAARKGAQHPAPWVFSVCTGRVCYCRELHRLPFTLNRFSRLVISRWAYLTLSTASRQTQELIWLVWFLEQQWHSWSQGLSMAVCLGSFHAVIGKKSKQSFIFFFYLKKSCSQEGATTDSLTHLSPFSL